MSHSAAAPAATEPTRYLGILLFDDVEELDAVGPWEVLASWTRHYPEDGYAVCCFSRDGRAVTAAKGLVLGAHCSMKDAPALEVLVHPGGQGTRPLVHDPGHLDWVRQQRREVPLMTSVCTGSLVYAAAGLLQGRPATTYWGALEELRALDPSVQVRPDDRWVDDGDVITSAGVSAGLDMALHLVARLAGADRARQVRRRIEYDPQPPRLTGRFFVRFFDANAYTADRAWDALDITTIEDATVRLHWTDQPYVWHVNDGPEVFVVLDGAVDMHYRSAEGERVERLTPGRICYAESGDEHVAHPAPQARILVVERNGSI